MQLKTTKLWIKDSWAPVKMDYGQENFDLKHNSESVCICGGL